jgi:putative oxygen-independent coproporphyrinogen III oxidase
MLVNSNELDSDYISIYVHWPYCVSKCPYCDFNSHQLEEIIEKDWIKAYNNEFHYFKDILQGKYVKSIFFGGGTPSLMPLSILESILNIISKIAIIDVNTEITLEANPSSVESEKFQSIANLGVNRISIGIQSFNDNSLKFLGRAHSSDEAKRALEIAKYHFKKTSFDLIYALPGQSLKDWETELNNAVLYSKDHISLYQLTIEKGTKFYKDYNNKEFTLPDQLISEDMYLFTDIFLKERNMYKYEISNYAALGQECKHNMAYWNYDNYLGIGPGAHSRISFKNGNSYAIMMKNKPNLWLDANLDLGNGIQNYALLTKEEIISEILMMGLRLRSGIDGSRVKKLTGQNWVDLLDSKAVKMFSGLGYFEYDNEKIKLTDKGLLLHNYIVPRLII